MGVALMGGTLSRNLVLEQFDDCALGDLPKTENPSTGYFSFIGHPIIGDKNYGNKETEKIAKEIGLSRQFTFKRH